MRHSHFQRAVFFSSVFNIPPFAITRILDFGSDNAAIREKLHGREWISSQLIAEASEAFFKNVRDEIAPNTVIDENWQTYNHKGELIKEEAYHNYLGSSYIGKATWITIILIE